VNIGEMNDRAHPAAMRTMLLLAVLLGACDYDDPDEPGLEEQVDFIRFSTSGTFREVFWDVTFMSGEFAIDVIAKQGGPWQLGPGTGFYYTYGTDHDLAPYPNPSRPLKQTPHDGAWDKRYWVQFAGMRWNMLGIRVYDQAAKFRASISPPPTVPMTSFAWCPDGGACVPWVIATKQGLAQCYRYSVDGYEKRVSRAVCAYHHPRMHWRVTACDDCKIPASEPFIREDE
jgi:hypothetical protein